MPSVSIVIPCYNEQDTIRSLLEAIYAQTYPRADLEVVIADGMSTDRTRAEISSFADLHPDLHIALVDNPKRIIPAALNCALKEATGEIIVRMDAHSKPYPDYVERSISDLEAGLGDNVGGLWEIQPGARTWMAGAIAAAASHPIGVGDALYRHAEKAALVDTVPFGAFKRELLALVGFYDESLLSNEDYEFNARIRQSGGKIWLDPSIRTIYFARPTLAELARQYARYGFWKWCMLRRYPGTLRWRQGLPPLFVLSLIGGTILGIFFPIFRSLLAFEVLIYIVVLAAAGLRAAIRQKKASLFAGLPLAIACMHITWGAGFLWSMIRGIFTNRRGNHAIP
ncbi:MAG TPA: glycosyltransferase family 2 protein [Anaerolineales bacterium]|nr:glycosyltransferase family 2 protein [Anaerolineales bacterium]